MDQVLAQIPAKAKSVMEHNNVTYKSPQQKSASTLTVSPILEHKQTFILLHGRGDHAVWFGGGLLDQSIPSYENLQNAFPYAKFIFPQAPRRNCARTPRWIMFQWFDNWGYDKSAEGKDHLKIEGLKETTAMVHDLIEKEAELLGGTRNIVLGGLSQGCAASLIAFLTWSGESLGGLLGMCGHLPFSKDIVGAINAEAPGESESEPALKAISWLREQVGVSASQALPFLDSPVFIGHGDQDRTVPTRLGREAASCLKLLGLHSSVYHEYKDLAHWYNEEMLHDFVEFFIKNTQQEIAEEVDRNPDLG